MNMRGDTWKTRYLLQGGKGWARVIHEFQDTIGKKAGGSIKAEPQKNTQKDGGLCIGKGGGGGRITNTW
jgi:hypothetical protein